MKSQLIRGAIAGAVGTVALNASTYIDIATRGRPPSSVPDEMVAKMADRAGVSLSSEGPDSPAAENRRTGLGALSGYATGIGVGIVYGLLRPRVRRLPGPVAGILAGLAAMAMTDTSATAAGVTDPRSWGVKGWLADVLPHTAYGLATAAAFDRLQAA